MSIFTYIWPWEIVKDSVGSIKFIINNGDIGDWVILIDYIKENDSRHHLKTFALINHPEKIIRIYLNTNLTFTSADYKLIDNVNVDYKRCDF